MSWREFLHHYADTLGVTAVFAVLGSGFLLGVGGDDISQQDPTSPSIEVFG